MEKVMEKASYKYQFRNTMLVENEDEFAICVSYLLYFCVYVCMHMYISRNRDKKIKEGKIENR